MHARGPLRILGKLCPLPLLLLANRGHWVEAALPVERRPGPLWLQGPRADLGALGCRRSYLEASRAAGFSGLTPFLAFTPMTTGWT